MTPEEAFEAGWYLRRCLMGSCHDGRDVARDLAAYPPLKKYLKVLDIRDTTLSRTEAVRKVKMAIIKDLQKLDTGSEA